MASSPAGSRPPLTTTSKPDGWVASTAVAPGVDGDHHGLAAEPRRARRHQRRIGDRARVQADLVRAGPQHVAHLVDAPDAAADRERDERPPRGALDDVEERGPALGRGGDVEEHELVGALAGVALGELGRVALVDEVDEPRALDDAPVRDVEAGDHAAAEHQAATRSRAAMPDHVRDQAQPVVARALRVELDAQQAAAGDRRDERAAVLRARRGPRRRRPVPDRRRTSGRSRSRRRRRCRRTRGGSASGRPGSSRCGGASGRPRGGPCGRAGCPGSRRRPRRCPRTGAGARGRCRGTGGPRRSSRGSARRSPPARSRSIAGAAAPTPGTTSRSVPSSASGRVARRTRAPAATSACSIETRLPAP